MTLSQVNYTKKDLTLTRRHFFDTLNANLEERSGDYENLEKQSKDEQ